MKNVFKEVLIRHRWYIVSIESPSCNVLVKPLTLLFYLIMRTILMIDLAQIKRLCKSAVLDAYKRLIQPKIIRRTRWCYKVWCLPAFGVMIKILDTQGSSLVRKMLDFILVRSKQIYIWLSNLLHDSVCFVSFVHWLVQKLLPHSVRGIINLHEKWLCLGPMFHVSGSLFLYTVNYHWLNVVFYTLKMWYLII